MKGWYGNSMKHSLASRGLKMRNQIRRLSSKKPFVIKEKTLEEVIEMIKQHPAVNEITLFGSRVKGGFRPDSDYDIMVFMNPNIEVNWDFYNDIFSATGKQFDIKFIDDLPAYGDLMWTYDRSEWIYDITGLEGMGGTPISVDILKDMKTLWRRPT